MGRRSTKTTKTGKFMNPTDQWRESDPRTRAAPLAPSAASARDLCVTLTTAALLVNLRREAAETKGAEEGGPF